MIILIKAIFFTMAMRFPILYSITNAIKNSVMVTLHSDRHPSATSSLNSIRFCKNCHDPSIEGSFVSALIAAQGPKEFNLKSLELVYAVPNAGEGGQLWNSKDVRGRVVLIDRGKGVTMAKKIEMVQEAGGSAVIIVDDGACNEDFNSCEKRGGSKSTGFGAFDHWKSWEAIDIPGLLITKDSGRKLKELLDLKKTEVPVLGEQWIEVHNA